MTINTTHIIVLAFGFGILLGCLVSYFLMRRSINQDMKSLTKVVNAMKIQKADKDIEYESRKENLLLLANKLKQIENNINKLRRREFDSYISDLNKILNSIGISRVKAGD